MVPRNVLDGLGAFAAPSRHRRRSPREQPAVGQIEHRRTVHLAGGRPAAGRQSRTRRRSGRPPRRSARHSAAATTGRCRPTTTNRTPSSPASLGRRSRPSSVAANASDDPAPLPEGENAEHDGRGGGRTDARATRPRRGRCSTSSCASSSRPWCIRRPDSQTRANPRTDGGALTTAAVSRSSASARSPWACKHPPGHRQTTGAQAVVRRAFRRLLGVVECELVVPPVVLDPGRDLERLGVRPRARAQARASARAPSSSHLAMRTRARARRARGLSCNAMARSSSSSAAALSYRSNAIAAASTSALAAASESPPRWACHATSSGSWRGRSRSTRAASRWMYARRAAVVSATKCLANQLVAERERTFPFLDDADPHARVHVLEQRRHRQARARRRARRCRLRCRAPPRHATSAHASPRPSTRATTASRTLAGSSDEPCGRELDEEQRVPAAARVQLCRPVLADELGDGVEVERAERDRPPRRRASVPSPGRFDATTSSRSPRRTANCSHSSVLDPARWMSSTTTTVGRSAGRPLDRPRAGWRTTPPARSPDRRRSSDHRLDGGRHPTEQRAERRRRRHRAPSSASSGRQAGGGGRRARRARAAAAARGRARRTGLSARARSLALGAPTRRARRSCRCPLRLRARRPAVAPAATDASRRSSTSSSVVRPTIEDSSAVTARAGCSTDLTEQHGGVQRLGLLHWVDAEVLGEPLARTRAYAASAEAGRPAAAWARISTRSAASSYGS